jgi:hypothetical protein
MEASEYSMTAVRIDVAVRAFDSRLATLDHLVGVGFEHLREPDSACFERRLAPDMLLLGAQCDLLQAAEKLYVVVEGWPEPIYRKHELCCRSTRGRTRYFPQ